MAIITVMNGNDSGTGSLRAALANASAGDTINFASNVTTIDLASSLVIATNVTIEGAQKGSTAPAVTINGGGSTSNFSDFTVNAGVTASIDGLVIADGHAAGAAGAYVPGFASYVGPGGAAAGGIYDAGALTLTNSVLQNDSAAGGAGGAPSFYDGGGAGGSAAGGIYVAASGSLTLAATDRFSGDNAAGGAGGGGGGGLIGQVSGGAGGAGGIAGIHGGVGASGQAGAYRNSNGTYSAHGGAAGGAPGEAGASGGASFYISGSGTLVTTSTAGGGGGGGAAFANVGGKGTISGPTTEVVANGSDDINTVGSLRYELAVARAGDTITFASNVTTIDLASSLVIDKNITIKSTSNVTINGGGSTSNFSDFTIDAGVTASIDGLTIAKGHATGAAGSYEIGFGGGATPGGGAAGGIYDAGALTLTNSVLQNDTATGGVGGSALFYDGGGAGGLAAGGIYVAATGSLTLAATDSFSGDSATGGAGGSGGSGIEENASGGAGGAGGISGVNGGIGASGQAGAYSNSNGASSPHGGGAGGAPGEAGASGGFSLNFGNGAFTSSGGGGGGGGKALANVGGNGALNLVVTNSSDNINTVGSLRYDLSLAGTGPTTITFEPTVTFIQLDSSLVIARNTDVTIEGTQPGSSGPGVLIVGGGSSSNFADFTIAAGATATIDGLIIADGHSTGAAGSYGANNGGTGGTGHGAAGGIYDAGTLTLTDSVLQNDHATGGVGGTGGLYSGNGPGGGGGAGGSAAGAIYVTSTGTLNVTSADLLQSNSATGGAGGRGGSTNYDGYTVGGGSGGAGGQSGVNGGVGQSGQTGSDTYAPSGLWGAGGAPGEPGHAGSAGGGGGGGDAFANIAGTGSVITIPCYCPGTRIRTARGEKRVETLQIGDKVMTASGTLRPIKWIGRRGYDGRFVSGNKEILPICIHAGALGDNVPKRNLWVSPHHAMYLEGVLIEAKDLVNGVSIVQAGSVESVEYFHVELDTHDVIIAEGALAESYIDEDNRTMFHNAPDYYARFGDAPILPARYCAPRLDEGYEVERARQRIALRAGLLRAVDPRLIDGPVGFVEGAAA